MHFQSAKRHYEKLSGKEKLELLLEWGIFDISAADMKNDNSESVSTLNSFRSPRVELDDPLLDAGLHERIEKNR